jgi:hypothetical protein
LVAAAPGTELARTARQGIDLMRRGVVAVTIDED